MIKIKHNKARNLIGCCGLYCGLCNKYQSKAPSRCIGCRLGEQHSWCSIYNCCVKKHRYEICAECGELFDCTVFQRRKVMDWIPVADNLHQIKEIGLESWLEEQKERQSILEKLLQNFNEGRSMSFYCRACTRLPIKLMNKTIEEAEEKFGRENVDTSDIKSKAKALKSIIKNLAFKTNINLD